MTKIITIDTKMEAIVVSQTFWAAHLSPRQSQVLWWAFHVVSDTTKAEIVV